VIESGVDDILLTWREALRALQDSSDGQQRDELTDQVRRLESLFGRRVDAGQVSLAQREAGDTLRDETMRVLGSRQDATRPDEPGEWY
jgi:hypothetical protein